MTIDYSLLDRAEEKRGRRGEDEEDEEGHLIQRDKRYIWENTENNWI